MWRVGARLAQRSRVASAEAGRASLWPAVVTGSSQDQRQQQFRLHWMDQAGQSCQNTRAEAQFGPARHTIAAPTSPLAQVPEPARRARTTALRHTLFTKLTLLGDPEHLLGGHTAPCRALAPPALGRLCCFRAPRWSCWLRRAGSQEQQQAAGSQVLLLVLGVVHVVAVVGAPGAPCFPFATMMPFAHLLTRPGVLFPHPGRQ